MVTRSRDCPSGMALGQAAVGSGELKYYLSDADIRKRSCGLIIAKSVRLLTAGCWLASAFQKSFVARRYP